MDNIAIIGMSCLYPNYVTKKNFWEKLINGEDFMSEEYFLGKKIERASMKRERSEEFFKQIFTKEEYDELDTYGELFKWVKYIVKETLEECGYLGDADKLKRTGIVMGAFGMPASEYVDLFQLLVKNTVEIGMKNFLQRDDYVYDYLKNINLKPQALLADTEPQSYVAKKFGLEGPILTLNAACSTPVYAMKKAIMYLQQGKADMMLTGTQCYNQMDFAISGMFDLLGILSMPGENKPFDISSKGVIAGSGAGMFALKRLNDAIRDKDNILGVIESIGWSSDGSSKFILAPDAEGQVRAYEDAYKKGVSPNIDYIECHATGTVAGDIVEIDSISKFFRKQGYHPRLGALKGNTGHFFTASSHAAIAKVLMGMKHDMIPQTIRIENPIDGEIVLKNTKWDAKNDIKRAAVNSFGFGGTNAHIVIREFVKEKEISNSFSISPLNDSSDKNKDVAIVGLGMHIGNITSVNEYYKYLLMNKSAVGKPPKERWYEIQYATEWLEKTGVNEIPKGAYITDFDFDYMEFKFPATGDEYFLRKDFLLLNVAKEAINDANISPNSHPNTAVIINCSMDFSELNFMSSRELKDTIAQSLRESCPDLTEDEIDSINEALQKSESYRHTPTAVPGMMPNIRASRISSKWGFNGPAYVIIERDNAIGRALELAKHLIEKEDMENVIIGSIELSGEMEHIYAQNLLGKGEMLRKHGIAEGAAVMVVKNLEAAKKDGNTIYSVLEDVAVTTNGSDVVGKLIEGLDTIINDESLDGSKIGYMEIPISSELEEKYATKNLVYNRYADYLEPSNFVEGAVEKTIGYGFSLTSAVAVIKNSLQLYNGIKFNELEGTYTTWNKEGKNRLALINSFNDEGTSAHIILSDYDGENNKPKKKIGTKNLVYPIIVRDETSLRERLESFINISIKKGLRDFYEETWNEFNASEKSGKTLCLIAKDKVALKKEAKLALENIDKFFKEGFKWESFNGSYYTASPVGKDAKITYMLPPGGMFSGKFFENTYRFPEYGQIYDEFINSSFMKGIKGDALEDYIMEILAAEISVRIAKELMGVNEDMVVAASMGEIASLFALDSISYEGNDYNSILSELVAVLKFMFEKDPTKENYFNKKIDSWQSWYVKGSKEELSKLVQEEQTVFMTIIGSPEDVVITGEGEACKGILNKFKGFGTEIKKATVIHSAIAAAIYSESGAEEFAEKIKYKRDLPYVIYNAFTQLPIDFSEDKFSDIFRNILTSPVDFLGSLKTAYKDGGRVFVDMSTNEVCSSWLSTALKDCDYLGLSIYSQKYSPEDNYIRTLAKLISNDVNFDLEKYLNMFEFDITNRPKLEKKVYLSIQSFVEGLADEENTEFHDNLVKKSEQLKEESKLVEEEKAETKAVETKVIVEEKISPKEIVEDHIEDRIEDDVKEIKPKEIYVSNNDKLIKEYKKRYLNKALMGNASAFNAYLNSEQLILNRLVQEMRNSKKTKIIDAKPQVEIEPPKKKNCLWNYDEIIEMTSNSMANVLGPRYEKVDQYPIRARLPLPPFMFVSRITKIDAEYGVFNKPAMIEIEYDVTDDCLLIVGDQVSQIVVTESAQIGIFLVAYMGIDEVSNGTLHFRIADTKAVVHSALPKIGETFRGVYEIRAFLKQGATTLVVNTYKAYVGDRLILTIDAIGGFFTEQDLENSKGVIEAPKINDKTLEEIREPIKFRTHKDFYDTKDLTNFYNGELEGNVHGSMENRRPIPEKARMLDKITYLTDQGGRYGLGEMFAEKSIDETHWAFKVHFVNDPVLPGSLILEGVNQMMYFLLDANIIGKEGQNYIEPCIGNHTKVVFRGQVRPIKSTIIYKISFKKFIETEEKFAIYFDADVYWEGTHIVKAEDLSLSIK